MPTRGCRTASTAVRLRVLGWWRRTDRGASSMCGIAGLWSVNWNATPTIAEIDAMVAALHHRGPDGRGVRVDGPIGLGHARLSIIDLAGGAQPMCNEDCTV